MPRSLSPDSDSRPSGNGAAPAPGNDPSTGSREPAGGRTGPLPVSGPPETRRERAPGGRHAPEVPRASGRPRRDPPGGRSRPTRPPVPVRAPREGCSGSPPSNPAPRIPCACFSLCRSPHTRMATGASGTIFAWGWNDGTSRRTARSAMITKCHGCWFPAEGALMAARRRDSIIGSGTGSSVYRRMLLRVRRASIAFIGLSSLSSPYAFPPARGRPAFPDHQIVHPPST